MELLEQKAFEKWCNNYRTKHSLGRWEYIAAKDAFHNGTVSLVTLIDELKKDNENLANQSMILLQQEAELELQMQKMKCCTTCKYYNMKYLPYWCDKLNEPKNCWRKCDDWELKEEEK